MNHPINDRNSSPPRSFFGSSRSGLLAFVGAVVLLLPLAACAQEAQETQEETREYVGPRTPEDGGAPFSQAVWIGNTLYLSGMLGLEGGQRPETAEAEATNVLNNVKRALESTGLTMDDLVTVQIFASDVDDYAAFNEVYRTFFTKEFPARAFVGSGRLLFDARFEVQGIAARRP